MPTFYTHDRTARPIAFLDSGVGGIGVLREVKKLLPREQLLYFGDSLNAPYGEKSDAQIKHLVLCAADRLLQTAKALVLACNTATAVAARSLRERYPHLPIIGMEPALHPAVAAGHRRILVLATQATLRTEKFLCLRQKCEKTATVLPLSAPGIVSGIVMVFMPTVSTFAIAELLTMNNIKLFGTTVQENIYNGMWNYGAALSLIMLLLIGIMGLFTNDDNAQNESGGVI